MLFSTLASVTVGAAFSIVSSVSSVSYESIKTPEPAVREETTTYDGCGITNGLMTDSGLIFDIDFFDNLVQTRNIIFINSHSEFSQEIGHSFELNNGIIRIGLKNVISEFRGKYDIKENLDYFGLELCYDNNRFFDINLLGGWNYYTTCNYLNHSIDFSNTTIVSVNPEFYYRTKKFLPESRIYIGFGIMNWQHLPDGKKTFSPVRIRYSWKGGIEFAEKGYGKIKIQPELGFLYFCEHEVVTSLGNVSYGGKTAGDLNYSVFNTGMVKMQCLIKVKF